MLQLSITIFYELLILSLYYVNEHKPVFGARCDQYIVSDSDHIMTAPETLEVESSVQLVMGYLELMIIVHNL